MKHSLMMCPSCRNFIDLAHKEVSQCSNCGTLYHQYCAELLDNQCAYCGSPLIPKFFRALRVFLCHSSKDKPSVRALYNRLNNETNIESWLDEEKILPGQDWEIEIKQAIRNSDVFIICLSDNSINKEGYVQKEISTALNVAEEKPENTIFIIPVKLEDCQVPQRLNRWQWVELFKSDGYGKLMEALKQRADKLGI